MDACIVITRSRIPDARVLVRSLREHAPRTQPVVLIADDLDGAGAGGDLDAVLVRATDLPGIDARELLRRAMAFDAVGLCGSLKPLLLRHRLQVTGRPAVLLDGDMRVYHPLDGVARALAGAPVALSPHSALPVEPDLLHRPEEIFLQAGVFNAGLVGVARGAEPFLDWWAQRTRRHCVVDPASGLFHEQRWLTLVPALFEHAVLRDPGLNVMGWNLAHRPVVWHRDRPYVGGHPLALFHFTAGFDPHHPDRLCPPEPWSAGWPDPRQSHGLARVTHGYARALLDAGYDAARAEGNRFDRLPRGIPIDVPMREMYRTALIESQHALRPEPPNPFADGEDAFVGFLESLAAATSAA